MEGGFFNDDGRQRERERESLLGEFSRLDSGFWGFLIQKKMDLRLI
jgi:hypothetical protein